MSVNPVNHREPSTSAIFARATCRAARRGRLRPLRRRETGEHFLRLFSSAIGAGQRISSLIHFLDLFKDLSAFSTSIFINRHGFLLLNEHIAWGIASKIPNHKFQNPNKLQIPISNDQIDLVSNLDNWNLFGIW